MVRCPGRDGSLKKLSGKASESHPSCLPSLPGQSVCSSPRRCQAGLPSMHSLPDKISPTPGRRHLSLPDSQPFPWMDSCSPCPTGTFQPAAEAPQGSPTLLGSLPLLWFRIWVPARFTKSQNSGKRPLGVTAPTPAQAGPPRAGCPGPRPDLKISEEETPQPLWAASPAQHRRAS